MMKSNISLVNVVELLSKFNEEELEIYNGISLDQMQVFLNNCTSDYAQMLIQLGGKLLEFLEMYKDNDCTDDV